jgi:hypothetical protein
MNMTNTPSCLESIALNRAGFAFAEGRTSPEVRRA